MSVDSKPQAILYTDDEKISLKYFRRAFAADFDIVTAENADEAWQIIEARGDEIGVLLTDQRMPGTSGVELLDRTRREYPEITRFLVTGYTTNCDEVLESVNRGEIHKFIEKPWDIEALRDLLSDALIREA